MAEIVKYEKPGKEKDVESIDFVADSNPECTDLLIEVRQALAGAVVVLGILKLINKK